MAWKTFLHHQVRCFLFAGIIAFGLAPLSSHATPANRAALDRHYERFLAPSLNRCTTCHLPSDKKDPQSLEEFPHNPFGHHLKELADTRKSTGQSRDISSRLQEAAADDSDGDGTANELELLLGHNPGNAQDAPTPVQLQRASQVQGEFAAFLNTYRWRPFQTVQRPPVPTVRNVRWVRNPIDAFIASKHESNGLAPRPMARKEILLRRVYLDLIGLLPTPDEQRAFLADRSSDAYEKVVERLLADPRHGERWGRHWMDVWRYSDWAGWADGNQIRDSKPHIWRWRDWIVESVNSGKGYDRMLLEMLAADEVAPLDTNALRATGFLVRNYKMLSREQWMEDTIKHTSQAFLGVTMGCAKCHDHMTDPISQADYYRLRAIFDPHHVRTDKLPGQLDPLKDGLVRAYDTATNRSTPIFIRGDERHPDTNRLMQAGVPSALCGLTAAGRNGGRLEIEPISLPRDAAEPDRRNFIRRDLLENSERLLAEAEAGLHRLQTNVSITPEKRTEQELVLAHAASRHRALLQTLEAEGLEDAGRKGSGAWADAATAALAAQRQAAVDEARLKRHQAEAAVTAALLKSDAQSGKEKEKEKSSGEKAAKELDGAKKKLAQAEKALAQAVKEMEAPASTAYKPRSMESYPLISSGRRAAFARWIIDPLNPLTARVAVNHIWLRHFGRGLVPTPADFGRNGRPPSHPELLDWLAAEFMEQGWSMKALHRLLVTSSTYRMASTPDDVNARRDEDNVHLWRMPSRRLEAEAVRDNLLYVSGSLDQTMGGPDIDHNQGLTSTRRSLYLRLAAEKEVEFLRIFDGPTVTECYERRPSVMPQQALALANSELALRLARKLAQTLTASSRSEEDFVAHAFLQILARRPSLEETQLCREFLLGQRPEVLQTSTPSPTKPDKSGSPQRRRENLVLVLFNHNDFVTVR